LTDARASMPTPACRKSAGLPDHPRPHAARVVTLPRGQYRFANPGPRRMVSGIISYIEMSLRYMTHWPKDGPGEAPFAKSAKIEFSENFSVETELNAMRL
jgi:hypothetical protein